MTDKAEVDCCRGNKPSAALPTLGWYPSSFYPPCKVRQERPEGNHNISIDIALRGDDVTLLFVPLILLKSPLTEVAHSLAEYWVRNGINNGFLHINTALVTISVALSVVARARNNDLNCTARSYLLSRL